MALAEPKIKAYKLFSNKLWNIARFVMEQTQEAADKDAITTPHDLEIVATFTELAADVTADMEHYRVYLAAEKLYHYLWDTFAAVIIEESKAIFKEGDAAAKASRKHALMYVLTESLKLLHPFMPFVTEAIWQNLPKKDLPAGRHGVDLLIVAEWPIKA